MVENKIHKISTNRFNIGYIDESGDSGKGGSKCLVLTYISLDERKRAYKILKKAKDMLRRTKKGERWLNRNGGELKFYGFPDKRVLLKTLEEIAKLKLPIQFVIIYKDGININPAIKIQILYDLIGQTFNLNEMPHKIIVDRDYFNNKKIAYIIVQDYEEIIDGTFKSYKYKFYLADNNMIKNSDKVNMLIAIKHENSKNNVGLQVADLISGAIFQEAEKNTKEYTETIRKHTKLQGRIIKLGEEQK